MPENSKSRKRMVVEEVKVTEPPKKEEEKKEVELEPKILDEAAKISSHELISEEKVQLNEEKPPEAKKQISPIFWIIIPGMFLLGAILGGIVFYQRGVNRGQEEAASPTPIAIASTAPIASPSATIDLTKYTIDILNGSGISGEAGKVKTILTTTGFKVGSTGNAATYDYTKTLIKAKSDVDAAFVSQLSTALGKTYLIDSSQTLATSSADEVQVVVGSSKVTQ